MDTSTAGETIPSLVVIADSLLRATERIVRNSSKAFANISDDNKKRLDVGSSLSPYTLRFFDELIFRPDNAWSYLRHALRYVKCDTSDENNRSSMSLSDFPSQRSPLCDMNENAFAARLRMFDLSRDLQREIVALRLCAFGVDNAVGARAIGHRNERNAESNPFRNFILLSNVLSNSSTCEKLDVPDSLSSWPSPVVPTGTNSYIARLLLNLRKDVLAERARVRVSNTLASDLARELRDLRERYDALLIEATTRYGEWYEYRREDRGCCDSVEPSPAASTVDVEMLDTFGRVDRDDFSEENTTENTTAEHTADVLNRSEFGPLINEAMRCTRLRVSSDAITTTTKSNDDRRYFVSAQRWVAMSEQDKLLESAEQLRSLLLHTHDSVQLLVQHKTVELERELTLEEDRRKAAFELELNAISAEIATVTERLDKLRDLAKHADLIERISTDVQSLISTIMRDLVSDLEEQRARNASLVTIHQNASKRILHVMETLAHERTGRSEISAITRDYLGRLTYPRVIDRKDLREIRDSVCTNNCTNMLKWALPKIRLERERRLRHLDEREPNIEPYATANEMRDALVACLYFYGTTETFISLVEQVYDYMRTPAKERFDIKNIYTFWKLSDMFNRAIASISDERLIRGLDVLLEIQLDLRSIPQTLFRAIIQIFRSRMSLATTEHKVGDARDTVWRRSVHGE